MNCPSADKLAAYFDGVLEPAEKLVVAQHVVSCASCQALLELYKDEESFMQATFSTPTLSDDFAETVLAQVPAYKSKKKRYWQRGIGAAAALLLVVGVTFSVSPSLADYVQSLFASKSADEGLHMALQAGAVIPVNLETTSNRRTILVEDVLVDTSRIGFTYKVVKANGKYAEPYIELGDGENTIVFKDMAGNVLDLQYTSWHRIDDEFGLFQFEIPDDFAVDQFTAELHVTKIGFVSGDWQLSVPFDLTKAKKQTVEYVLDERYEYAGVDVLLQKLRFTSSQTELTFTSQLTDDEFAEQQAEQQATAAMYGDANHQLGTELHFTLENEVGETVVSSEFSDGKFIQAMGSSLEKNAGTEVKMGFVPLNDEGPLTFVLNGVYKTKPVLEKLVIDTQNLDHNEPLKLDDQILRVTNIHHEKPFVLNPFDNENYIEIMLTAITEATAPQLDSWRIQVDGENYDVFPSSYSTGDADAQGNYEMNWQLRVYGLEEIPDTMTLILTQIKEYIPLEAPWKVKLMK